MQFRTIGEHRGMIHQAAGMQIDRHIELLHPLPEREIPVLIEIVATGLAVDQRALEPEILDGALQFVGRGADILHRQMGEAGIAMRPLLYLARQQVVGAARQPDRALGIGLGLHAGGGDRKHGDIDAGLVHGLEPQLVEVGKALLDIGKDAVALRRSRHVFGKLGRGEMLFKRDLSHCSPNNPGR